MSRNPLLDQKDLFIRVCMSCTRVVKNNKDDKFYCPNCKRNLYECMTAVISFQELKRIKRIIKKSA